mmetsp:Transcript_79351/g.202066  ORF Transcript_79351/g.202066 Transcript_79351/m.202066 type:complete len:405 (+) Transcript_79351:45-1259(+)
MAWLSFNTLLCAGAVVFAGWFVAALPLQLRNSRREQVAVSVAVKDEPGLDFAPSDLKGDHIEQGLPKPGHTYFYSIGDFGVYGCQNAFERGDLEENGGIGHEACMGHEQEKVAEAMDRLAAFLHPQFVISLGDNFYVRGVTDMKDQQFLESFEAIYDRGALADVPWKILLGDHDHRGNVTALLLHTNRSQRWRLPSLHYRFEVPLPDGSGRNLEVVMADSVCLEGGMEPDLVAKRRFEAEYSEAFVGVAAAQEHWRSLEENFKSTRPAIRIIAAHRPVVSMVNRPRTASEPQVEERLHKMLVAAAADSPVLYMHGHDHAMQLWKDSEAQLTYIGNGVGGMGLHQFLPQSHARARGAEFKWGSNGAYGFAIHELGADALNTYFVAGDAGRVLYATSIPIPSAQPA